LATITEVQANKAGQLNWFRQLVLEVKAASFAQYQKGANPFNDLQTLVISERASRFNSGIFWGVMAASPNVVAQRDSAFAFG
jgi:hypothetical protein